MQASHVAFFASAFQALQVVPSSSAEHAVTYASMSAALHAPSMATGWKAGGMKPGMCPLQRGPSAGASAGPVSSGIEVSGKVERLASEASSVEESGGTLRDGLS